MIQRVLTGVTALLAGVLITWFVANAGVGMKAPDITNETWLNSAPLHLSDLNGKVVMVEFWTFGCYNCRNVEPYVKQWYQKYADKGFVVIGVHSPEFSYEHDLAKVKQYIREHDIRFPIPIDNDFSTWNRYGNRYWPAMYLIDRQGVIRHVRIGEGRYQETEGLSNRCWLRRSNLPVALVEDWRFGKLPFFLSDCIGCESLLKYFRLFVMPAELFDLWFQLPGQSASSNRFLRCFAHGDTGQGAIRNLDVGTARTLHLENTGNLTGAPMARLHVLKSGKKSSALQDAAALTTQLAAGLEKIGLAMKSRTWRREGRAGLGPLQRQVLTLLRSKPGQRAQVSTVANELAIRLPTASEVIATLERKQLLRRRRDMSDGRIVMAQLTAKGNRSCTPSSRMPDRLATATEALSEPEQVILLTSLVKVIRSLQEQGEISVARMCVSCNSFRPNQHANADRPHHCDSLNIPLGDRSLRLDCHVFEPASTVQINEAWANFTGSRTA